MVPSRAIGSFRIRFSFTSRLGPSSSLAPIGVAIGPGDIETIRAPLAPQSPARRRHIRLSAHFDSR